MFIVTQYIPSKRSDNFFSTAWNLVSCCFSQSNSKMCNLGYVTLRHSRTVGGSGDAVSSGGCFMTCPSATAPSVTAVRALIPIATSRTAHPNTRHHGVTSAAPPSTPQFSYFQLLLRWHNQFSLWPPTAHAPASSFRLFLRLRRNGQRVCLRRRNIRLKAVQGLICKVDTWGWYVRLQQRWAWMTVSSVHRSRVAYRRHVHGTYQSGWQQKIHSPVSFPTSTDFYKPTWRPLPSDSILNEASFWPHWSVLVRRDYRGITIVITTTIIQAGQSEGRFQGRAGYLCSVFTPTVGPPSRLFSGHWE